MPEIDCTVKPGGQISSAVANPVLNPPAMGTVEPIKSPEPAAANFADGLANLYSRLGTSADHNTQSYYWVPPLTQQQIEAAYRTSWLTRKVHDLPPFEMTRAGRDWQAEAKQILALESYEKRLNLWGKLRQALGVARLHGGAAIILGVRQGMPDQPLRVESLGKETLRYALIVSRHQLSAPFGMESDLESDFYGQPAMYEMRGAKGNSVRIHPSRVIPFHGQPIPAGAVTVSQIDQFWGDPLLQSIKTAIDNAETSQAAVATLLHEMKQDVISIPGLTEQIATEGAEGKLAARIEALNRFRSMFNALLLDGGDDDGKGGEEWETRQLSFSNYPELLRQFLATVAGAADIPVTRLMGESPGGLQSTGKGEQDDFNRMIDAKRDAELGPALARLDEILIRAALGLRPDEVGYTFGELADPDEKEQSENEKREAETVEIYDRTGIIPKDALAKAAANRMIESGRWPGLDQAIAESQQELGALDDPNAADPAADPNALPQPANDPGQPDEMQRRGTITRDQAIALLADASPRPLYVHRKLLNADELIAWAKEQGFEVSERPADLHVTVVYSKRPVDWLQADEDWTNDDEGGYTVKAGGPRMVDRLGDKGAIVLLFGSSHLSYRHESILRQVGGSHDFSEYQPHVTFTYAAADDETLERARKNPFTGKLRFGPEIFEEIDDNWRDK